MNRTLRAVLPLAAATVLTGMATAASAAPAQVAAAALNVRSGAGTGYPVIDVLRGGEVVNIVARLGNGWCRIEMPGRDGYVSCSYLSGVGGPAVARVEVVPAPRWYYDSYYGFPAGVSLYLYGGRPFYWRDGRRVYVKRRDHDDKRITVRRGGKHDFRRYGSDGEFPRSRAEDSRTMTLDRGNRMISGEGDIGRRRGFDGEATGAIGRRDDKGPRLRMRGRDED